MVVKEGLHTTGFETCDSNEQDYASLAIWAYNFVLITRNFSLEAMYKLISCTEKIRTTVQNKRQVYISKLVWCKVELQTICSKWNPTSRLTSLFIGMTQLKNWDF